MSKKLTDKMLRKWVEDKVVLNNRRNSALYCLQYARFHHLRDDEVRCFHNLFLFHIYRDEVLELMAKWDVEWAKLDVERLLVGEEL